jgi:hypothetical protein
MPLNWTCPDTGKTFKTGLDATPQQRMLSAMNAQPFVPLAAPPAHYGFFPAYRSPYGNDTYGDCVTAEEAFTKSCYGYNIPDSVVISWARSHGWLNGADLGNVADAMRSKGFQVGSQLYNDGQRFSVDFTNTTVVQAAIAQHGPVKIAIAAGALPGGAGSRDGWFSLSARNHNTDHCVAIAGYGEAGWIFEQLKIALPSGLTASTIGYALYTWATIGFVTPEWINGTTDEAMVRDPTNVGVPPLPDPTPPTPPVPPPGPGPGPSAIELTISHALPAGKYSVLAKI